MVQIIIQNRHISIFLQRDHVCPSLFILTLGELKQVPFELSHLPLLVTSLKIKYREQTFKDMPLRVRYIALLLYVFNYAVYPHVYLHVPTFIQTCASLIAK